MKNRKLFVYMAWLLLIDDLILRGFAITPVSSLIYTVVAF